MADPHGVWGSGSPVFQSWPPPPGHPLQQVYPSGGARSGPLHSPPLYPRPPATQGFAPGFGPQQAFYCPPPPPPPYLPLPGAPPPNNFGFNPEVQFPGRVHFSPQTPPGLPDQGFSRLTFPGQSFKGGTGHVFNAFVSSTEDPIISNDSRQTLNAATPHNSVYPPGQAEIDNVMFSNREEGIDVIEQAILACRSQKEKPDSVTELISQVRALLAEAEKTVEKIGEMVSIDPTTVESQHLVTCPFNSSHRMPSSALFKHFLCCPSNPTTTPINGSSLISSLRYTKTLPADPKKITEVIVGTDRTLDLKASGVDGSNCSDDQPNVIGEIDIWGGRLFYQKSSAVVQAPLATVYPLVLPEENLSVTIGGPSLLQAKVELPNNVCSVSSEQGTDGLSPKKKVCGDASGTILPSRYWLLVREIQMWKELPTRCSSLVLQAGAALGRVRKKTLLQWILWQNPSHGVVIDSAMAGHIYCLAKVCLKSLQRDSSALIENLPDCTKERDRVLVHSEGDQNAEPCSQEMLPETGGAGLAAVQQESTPVQMKESASRNADRCFKLSTLCCPRLFESGHFLMSQLSILFGPMQSNGFVLKLLKYCLVTSGRCLASVFLDAFPNARQHEKSSAENPGDLNVDGESQIFKVERMVGDESLMASEEPLEWLDSVEVNEAMAAVHERAILERYLRNVNQSNKTSRVQMAQEHDALVTLAANERRMRPNYRPVLEHDGLIWHRSHLQDKNQNKSREEILAEERDYKRRRMSYRGKKLKRNPTQVLHDIIDGHMEEIVSAGGIGCLAKHPVDVQLTPDIGTKEKSRVSDMSTVEDGIASKSTRDDVPNVVKGTQFQVDTREKRSWNDHSRVQFEQRDSSSTENFRSLKPRDDYAHQSYKHIRLEFAGSHDEHFERSMSRRESSYDECKKRSVEKRKGLHNERNKQSTNEKETSHNECSERNMPKRERARDKGSKKSVYERESSRDCSERSLSERESFHDKHKRRSSMYERKGSHDESRKWQTSKREGSQHEINGRSMYKRDDSERRSHRHDSDYSSDGQEKRRQRKDDRNLDSQTRCNGSHDRDSKGRDMDIWESDTEKEHDNNLVDWYVSEDQRHSQRHLERWEGSNEDNGFDRYHCREQRKEKSKGRH